MPIVQIILALLTQAPQALTEITALYERLKSDISETDQAKVDQALADAQKSDEAATIRAQSDLSAAEGG